MLLFSSAYPWCFWKLYCRIYIGDDPLHVLFVRVPLIYKAFILGGYNVLHHIFLLFDQSESSLVPHWTFVDAAYDTFREWPIAGRLKIMLAFSVIYKH